MNKVLCELLWKRKNGVGLLGPSSCLLLVGCADRRPTDPHQPSSRVRSVGFRQAQTLVNLPFRSQVQVQDQGHDTSLMCCLKLAVRASRLSVPTAPLGPPPSTAATLSPYSSSTVLEKWL